LLALAAIACFVDVACVLLMILEKFYGLMVVIKGMILMDGKKICLVAAVPKGRQKHH